MYSPSHFYPSTPNQHPISYHSTIPLHIAGHSLLNANLVPYSLIALRYILSILNRC
ncbi:hypothetical protein CPC08DRAFT_709879 [Agrocybe pediades]|nr:hypothetical protein CPC08DRAFT_709879 [Agrocybe pediades]